MRFALSLGFLMLCSACIDDGVGSTPDTAPPTTDAGSDTSGMDTSVTDTNTSRDTNAPGRDTSSPDTSGPDTSVPDTSVAPDTSVRPDTTPAPDTSTPPSGLESMVRFETLTASHGATDPRWGAELTDIIQHLPRSFGDTYYDADFITYGHETTHGINSHIRNTIGLGGPRKNGFYVLNDRAALVREPNIRKSAVAAYVPASLRGSRFSLYVTGSPDWDDTPLYIYDEWVAYVNGGEVGVGRHGAGLWREGWRDAVAGQLEFTAYAIAVCMAVEAGDPAYFRDEVQFLAFTAWLMRRSMERFHEGAAITDFAWDEQDRFLRDFRENPDGEVMRTFARRVFGAAWTSEVLGF